PLLYSCAVSLVGASVRLGSLTHVQAQQILHSTKDELMNCARRSSAIAWRSMRAFSPMLDVMGMQHVYLQSRMFYCEAQGLAKKIIRLGIGGPVGSGKTTLIEKLTVDLSRRGIKLAIISNDVVTKEDAIRLHDKLCHELKILPDDLVVGIETGGCRHTAVREDPSINIDALQQIETRHPELDLVMIEGAAITSPSPSARRSRTSSSTSLIPREERSIL